MKADRRHELRENDLEHWLRTAGDYINANGKTVGLLVVAVVAVVGGYLVITGQAEASRIGAWKNMSALTSNESLKDADAVKSSLDQLASLREANTAKDFAMASLITQADVALHQALQVDNPPDPKLNALARSAFEELLQRYGNRVPLAFGAAHCGLATVEENEFAIDGDMSHKQAADEHLKKVVNHTALNVTPLNGIAIDRRARLDETFKKVTFAPPAPEIETTPPTGEKDNVNLPPGVKNISLTPITPPPPPTSSPTSEDNSTDEGVSEAEDDTSETSDS